MKQRLYVIYDVVSQESSNIMQAKNDALAYRMYERAIHDNPDGNDFALYRIGEFDTERMTGNFNSVPEKVTGFEGGKEDVGI